MSKLGCKIQDGCQNIYILVHIFALSCHRKMIWVSISMFFLSRISILVIQLLLNESMDNLGGKTQDGCQKYIYYFTSYLSVVTKYDFGIQFRGFLVKIFANILSFLSQVQWLDLLLACCLVEHCWLQLPSLSYIQLRPRKVHLGF